MNFFYYLNYVIFRFYRRNGEADMAEYDSFLVVVLLFCLNAISFLFVIKILYVNGILCFKLPLNKFVGFCLITFFSLTVYLLLYRRGHWRDVFRNFDDHQGDHLYDSYEKPVKLYILVSIVVMLLSLTIVDYYNHLKPSLITSFIMFVPGAKSCARL